MDFKSAADTKYSNDGRINIEDLESQIFERLQSDLYFKDILEPFAVLKKSATMVILGSTQKIVGKVNYNFTLENNLREIVASIMNNPCISVEVRVAEDEFQKVTKRIQKISAKKKKNLEIENEIQRQKIQGKCNLIPFPVKENKVRSDLTVERYAIFAANTFKGDFRLYERKIKDPQTGENIIFRIEVGDKIGQVRGVLKQKHQETFYKLVQLWAEQNYSIIPDDSEKFLYGSFELSVYELVKKIRNDDAGHHYQSVMRLLKEMSTIRVCIKKIYEDNSFDFEDFTLLSFGSSAKGFNEKTLKHKSGGFSKIRICFSDFVTYNFLQKNIKTLMLNPYLSLKDKGRKGVAQLLYTMLDYELSSKSKFHISLENLSKRLGVTQYQYKSKRKEKLVSSIKAINGTTILDGKFKIDALLVESEDKKDWVLVAKAIPIQC